MIVLGFETTHKLYESASSTVYRARAVDGTGTVVLKILNGDHPRPQALARFGRAFATAAQIASPRTLKVYRQDRHNNTLVSVVEDFDADSLSNWIRDGDLSFRERLTIAVAISEALSDVHNFGMIHKDITPANVLWNRATNTVKLTDFGSSAPMSQTAAVAYSPSVLEGTLSSMSPEQTGRMNRPMDYRSDFYSLGVTLYELFTGEKPFASDDPLEMIHCHVAKRPMPPVRRAAETPQALSDIVLKLMEKNAEDRYQSTTGITADLVECLRQFDAAGTISPFPPARHDVFSRFQLSGKLYGRAADVAVLSDAFGGVVAGAMTFTLVGGRSGVGKSVLVQELYRPLAVARGRYVSGKYDQYQRSVPYSAITQALNSFCDLLLCETAEIAQSWRHLLLGIVGKNGGILVDVIPSLEKIIGPQPPGPEREPQAAQNLLTQLFQDFIRAICRPEEPLVLFLDDLQWADVASFALIKAIVTNPRLHGLHLVGAYRDNEVSATHPLVAMLAELTAADRAFATIHLGDLSYESVAALVSDTLSTTSAEIADLAHIVYSKTHGNAFFAAEFFKALHADGLLRFDVGRGQWGWDAASIHARGITDNVVALMADRLTTLPETTQESLSFAACVGNRFTLSTLEVIGNGGGAPHSVGASLEPALRLGVIAVTAADSRSGNEPADGQQTSYRFQHDRVQQAAYSSIPEAARPARHLHIARQLLAAAGGRPDFGGRLFEIVSHFKKGMPGIETKEERVEAARLTLQAGLKARKSSAHHASWEHFQVARDLLPPDSFDTDYDLAFQIHLGLAKSASVAGQCAEADALYPLLLQQAATTLDRSQVHLVRMDDYHLQGAYDRAIEVQKTALALLGEIVPSTERELAAAIDRELRSTPRYRGTRSIADLITAPEIESPEISATLKVLMGLWIGAHLVSNEPLVQWTTTRLTNLSLRHGNSEMAAFAFVQHGYLCIARLERFEEGHEYGRLALTLADRYENLEMRGKIYFMFGLCICHWKEHLNRATEYLLKAYEFSVESGDWTYAVYGACNIISNLIAAGVHFDIIDAEARKYLEFLKDKAVIGLNSFFLPGGYCALLNLQGKTVARNSFSCQYLDEDVFLATLGQLPTCEAWFYSHKIRSLYYFRSFETAHQTIAKADRIAAALPAQIRISEGYFYGCLMLAATELAEGHAHLVGPAWTLFERYEERFRVWADHCPENHGHKYFLIKGERARLEKRSLDEVLGWFDRAIQAARDSGFVNNLALVHELKGRFWLERQQLEYALADLRQAHAGYRAWGATGKVAMLEEEFVGLAAGPTDQPLLTPAHLDLLSVHKAARAISAKIEVRGLIETMMTIVVESAGADRGVLMLETAGGWAVEACADLCETGIDITFPANPDYRPKAGQLQNVPTAIINYVVRTQAALMVSVPLRDPRFGHDPYVIEAAPRAILCLPVVSQGRTTGIIYLENKLGADVFSNDRRDLIDVLAGQIAISLENATLYADLQRTVASQNQMMETLASQQVELRQTNDELVEQEIQLSKQAVELRARNEEISVVSLQWKMAEAETRRLNAELEQRVQDRTADLRRSNEELEQFAYIASHDLQEPLRKVSSFAQLLANQYKGKLDADADEFIGYMVDGARRMQTLIQNMLAYSRLGRKGKPFAPVDGAAVLTQALANLQGAVEDSCAVVTSGPLPTVLGDGVQLVQLLQNLIGNAIKFCGAKKPVVDIRAEPAGTAWTFSVRDNGIGIDPQFAERIFVIFQRLHNREEYPGTGIGLAFCKKIVDRHGGRIWVDSSPGQGAVFSFTLPSLVEPEQKPNERANEPRHDRDPVGGRRSGRRPVDGGSPEAHEDAHQPQLRP